MLEQYPEAVKELLANILVVKAEMDYCLNGILYTAISELFTELPEYVITPIYELEELTVKKLKLVRVM